MEAKKSQKDVMEEKEDRIRALTEELEMTKQRFSDTQKDLAEKELELSKTSKLLAVTCKALSKTTRERDEQQHLVHRHTETEKLLLAQAQMLQTVAVQSSSDAEELHKKLLRKKHAEEINKQKFQSFQERLDNDLIELIDLVVDNTCTQLHELKSTLASLDSETAERQEFSQQLENIFSTQKEALAQPEEELEAGTDQLGQSVQYLGRGEIAKDAVELHKMARKHLDLRVNCASELKNKIGHLRQATLDLEESVDKWLTQQLNQHACFFHKDLLTDIPTGQTPPRREYSFPSTLAATSPHDRILREFRVNQLVEAAQKQMEAAQNLPLPDMDDFDKSSVH